MNTINIWSNIPGQWYKASTESDAKTAANEVRGQGGRSVIKEIKSVGELVQFFTELCQQSAEWNLVRFHTHGSPGSIALGSESLDLDTYQRLENNDFDRLFAAGCTITFEGCNVAEQARGEFFLVEIAHTLLMRNGGRVRGNTNVGLGVWGGGDSTHPLGTWVTANMSTGGALRLENGQFLHSDNIRNRGDAALAKIADLDKRGWLKPGQRTEIELAVQQARIYMASDGFYRRYEACKWLNYAEFKLSQISNAPLMDRAMWGSGF